MLAVSGHALTIGGLRFVRSSSSRRFWESLLRATCFRPTVETRASDGAATTAPAVRRRPTAVGRAACARLAATDSATRSARRPCAAPMGSTIRARASCDAPPAASWSTSTRSTTGNVVSTVTCWTAVWQLQPNIAQTVQQQVSYEFSWIRRTCDYILLNVHYCVLFSSRVGVRVRIRVRIRFSVLLVICYAHVFVRL